MALDLGKQVGPMPLGAWIAVVAGGIGIAVYTKQNSAGDDGSSDPTRDISGTPGVGVGGNTGDFTDASPQPGNVQVDPRAAVTDNQSWYTYVCSELIGRYNYNPELVTSALTKYITGSGTPSVSERVIIGRALTIMIPPDPISSDTPPGTPPPTGPVIPPPPTNVPGPVKPKPVPKPAPKPAPKPVARYYTVKKGDTLFSIAKKYFGNGAQWTRIYNANLKGKTLPNGHKGMIANPNHIEAGWSLHIPN